MANSLMAKINDKPTATSHSAIIALEDGKQVLASTQAVNYEFTHQITGTHKTVKVRATDVKYVGANINLGMISNPDAIQASKTSKALVQHSSIQDYADSLAVQSTLGLLRECVESLEFVQAFQASSSSKKTENGVLRINEVHVQGFARPMANSLTDPNAPPISADQFPSFKSIFDQGKQQYELDQTINNDTAKEIHDIIYQQTLC